jgi:hypothetical protein
MLESFTQRKTRTWITAHGGKAIKIKQGEGEPDLLIGYKGKLYLIEMKKQKGGKVSPLQKAIHAEWLCAGVTVHVARSLEEVKEILERG